MRHAMDADHVVAVTTIVSRERTLWSAGLIGGLWGLGHTVTVAIVGGAIILFDVVIPPRVGLAMEFLVALMLILLGTVNLAGMVRKTGGPDGQAANVHAHPHNHQGYVHEHAHGHDAGAHGHKASETPLARVDAMFGRLGAYRTVRPIVVGVVHGLAGSAAVALLVLASIRDPRWAVLYLLLFGVGTIIGMMIITAAISLPFAYAEGRFIRAHRHLRVATSLLSIVFGLVLAYQIGIVNGLLGANPQWSPK
jgi:high-affinity nickel-transport protein